jgi:hypothetical protein
MKASRDGLALYTMQNGIGVRFIQRAWHEIFFAKAGIKARIATKRSGAANGDQGQHMQKLTVCGGDHRNGLEYFWNLLN